MATHANSTATAKRNALRKVATVQQVTPITAPGGCLVTTYTSAKLGVCQVLARLLNPQGMLVAYRVKYNGQPYTVPAGNGTAIGQVFIAYAPS